MWSRHRPVFRDLGPQGWSHHRHHCWSYRRNPVPSKRTQSVPRGPSLHASARPGSPLRHLSGFRIVAPTCTLGLKDLRYMRIQGHLKCHPGMGTLSVDLSLGSRPGSHEAPAQARLTWLGPDWPRPLLTGSRRLTHPLSCCLRHTSRARLPLQPLRAACLTHECPATPPSGPTRLHCSGPWPGPVSSRSGSGRALPSPPSTPHFVCLSPLSSARSPLLFPCCSALCRLSHHVPLPPTDSH